LGVGVLEGVVAGRRRGQDVRAAAGGQLQQCLGGLLWQVVDDIEERILGG
jgi:hypothetical protein